MTQINKYSLDSVQDLGKRSYLFALNTKEFLQKAPRTIINTEYISQLTRSSGSVGANYIEANESLSCKDFKYRIRICLKEAKESRYWLKLLDLSDTENSILKNRLINEATELIKIFSSILKRTEN